MRSRSFSERFPPDHPGPMYGPLFRAVRVMPCWLETQMYEGPGHAGCWAGTQGGHTAHHLGKTDEAGMIPCCGRAHDLFVGRGGRTAVQHFAAWMQRMGFTLKEVGQLYVVKAQGIDPERDLDY